MPLLKKSCWLILLVSAVLCLTFPDSADACPTCKNSLHDNGAATGYAISILFMMVMPFAIFTFWTVLIVRLRRKLLESNLETSCELVGELPTA